jgi:hypothetical protein
MIYISNNIFLTSFSGDINSNNPIIGYKSVLRPQDITTNRTPIRPAVNAWTPDTATVYEGSSSPGTDQQYLILHNATGATIDYIGIARHNFFSTGRAYKIEESVDNVNWTDVTTAKIPASDGSILEYFDARSTQYFRIDLDDLSGRAPIIGHVKMGEVLVLQRRIYAGHNPAALAPMVKKTTYGSETGQYLGQIVHRSYHKTSLEQENNSPAFIRQNIVPFINHVNGHAVVEDTAVSTFFFAWRPSSYPDEIVYGWTNDNIQPTNTGGDGLGGRMSWGMSIEAIA